MFDQLTLWVLRRFKLFRSLEQRLEKLASHEAIELTLPMASTARIEAEVLHALLLHTPCWVECDSMPTKRVEWLGPGQIRVQLFEGGGSDG